MNMYTNLVKYRSTDPCFPTELVESWPENTYTTQLDRGTVTVWDVPDADGWRLGEARLVKAYGVGEWRSVSRVQIPN